MRVAIQLPGSAEASAVSLGRGDFTVFAFKCGVLSCAELRRLFDPIGGGSMAIGIGRRQFVAALGGTVAWPLLPSLLLAQEAGRTYRLGFLSGAARDAPRILALFDEIRIFGFVEGKNLTVVPGGFGLPNEQLPSAAATIVKTAPDAIFCVGDLAMHVAKDATSLMPIVGLASDMVATGLVRSFAHPGGNVTGVSVIAPELDGKRQDILMEAAPGTPRIAALADFNVTTSRQLELQNAARARGVELIIVAARTPEAIGPAMSDAKAAGAAAVNVLASPLFSFNRRLLIERAATLRLPAIYEWPEMAEEGGLMGYGTRLDMIYRQTARLLVKALLGVKPADIPVEQPTSFELVINLKAAKAINFTVPPTLLARADEVIE
jgi:putative tryptophan/tyrosine transport system substrate-binding protein